MQGIPHVNNNMFLTGLDLEYRWKITWDDICERMIRDGLQSVSMRKFREIQAERAAKNNPYTHGSRLNINPWNTGESFSSYCGRLHPEHAKFLLEDHIWPYEEVHPKLKASALEYYEENTAIQWDPKGEGGLLKNAYNKVPNDPELQQRDLLVYFMCRKEDFTLAEVQNFLQKRGDKSTVSGWKKSGELIFKRLMEKKKDV
jgi:hypothetical protein